ncbi:MAG: hypothetical protein QG551_180 [Patescibacteria group bacterium]|jgi:hypothetical protein|nr:hypothetical protein [Patescibacteria group bacterium]
MESENKTMSLLGKICILLLVVSAGAYIITRDKKVEPINEATENQTTENTETTALDSKTDIEVIGSEMDTFDTNFDDMNGEDLDM